MRPPLPAFGGEKARRLFWAAKNNGIVKFVPPKFLWIFENVPKTITSEGEIIGALDFVHMISNTLEISETDVYLLDDDTIRFAALKIAGIDEARDDARGQGYAAQ